MKILLLLLLPLWASAQLGETRENTLGHLNQPGCTIESFQDCVVQLYPQCCICYNFEKDTCTSIMLFGNNKPADPFYTSFMMNLVICCDTESSGIYFSRDYLVYKVTE